MTSIENRLCACPEKGMRHSPKAHDFTSTERRPSKQSNLEKYKECRCTDGKCKMSQLLKICQEDPDLIINMYRASKSEDKCLPEIEMDGGQVHESSEQINEAIGKKKYHYLMTDQSTNFSPGESHLKHEPTKIVDAKKSTIETKKDTVLGKKPSSGSCSPTLPEKTSNSSPGKSIIHEHVINGHVTNEHSVTIQDAPEDNIKTSLDETSTSKDDTSTKSIGDESKNVLTVEPTSQTLNERIEGSLVTNEVKEVSSHIMSVLNLLVKKQKESTHAMAYATKRETVMERRCLSWLGCLPCVKSRKHKNRNFKHNVSVVSSVKSSNETLRTAQQHIVWE